MEFVPTAGQCDRWVDVLEDEYLAPQTRWDKGSFGDGTSLFYLVADGAYSASRGHWSAQLASKFRRAGLSGAVVGFSYTDYGRHYHAESTAARLNQSAVIWRRYMGHLIPGQRLIPVAFSLGGPVTLLGIEGWLSSPEGSQVEASATLPAVVLVQPAFSLHPCVREAYLRRKAAGGIDQVPWPVQELSRSSVSDRLKAACQTLRERGIQLHVVYWPLDVFTPQNDIPGSLLPVRNQEYLDDLARAVEEHVATKTHRETEATLIELLSAYGP